MGRAESTLIKAEGNVDGKMNEKERPSHLNALAKERSPYLRKHADNPINWLPWGEEAFKRAKEEQKPIFLSIGYSSCHWCSVMERESFRDPKIAEFVNRHFVPVKVDREERPDVDEFYIRAVQAMTGQAGWPLNVFLTPDLKPFFGGTYFPPRRSMGLPSFLEVLQEVARVWRERREEVIASAERIAKVLKLALTPRYSETDVDVSPLEEAYGQLVLEFDQDFGGFGSYPKFPMPSYIILLLRYYWLRHDKIAAKMVEKTLKAMYRGGIYDHVGGGFHRYATDRAWIVPHFEKMLYDNALLVRTYAEAHRALGDPELKECALDVIDWLVREMSNQDGGFYAAVDADSEGEEGKYYLWRKDEIISIFGRDVGEVVARYYGLTEKGNFGNGLNVLHVKGSDEELSSSLSMPANEAKLMIRRALRSYRETRTKPFVDKKIIVSWNSMVISALAYAGWIWGLRELIGLSIKTAEFITTKLMDGDVVKRYWLDGPSDVEGRLEDYSYLANALADLYSYTGTKKYLELAEDLAKAMIREFSSESGAFFNTRSSGSEEVLRIVDASDGATPSGNSVAVVAFAKLHHLTGKDHYMESAKRIVSCFWKDLRSIPLNYSYMVANLGYLTKESTQLVCVVKDGDLMEESLKLGTSLPFSPYLTASVVSEQSAYNASNELLRDKRTIDGKTTYYLCRGFVCDSPTSELSELVRRLSELNR